MVLAGAGWEAKFWGEGGGEGGSYLLFKQGIVNVSALKYPMATVCSNTSLETEG